MTKDRPTSSNRRRYSSLAVLGYVVAVAALIAVSGISLADLYDQYRGLRSASDLLNQLDARNIASLSPTSPLNRGPTGSPFLEGPTVTVAGAALLQRVAGAVTRLGGNVLSSQVDVSSTAAKPNFVSLLASCEIDGPALGALLYDIEAGMPFLFVDQLVVQAPQSIGRVETGKLRVMLGVSGQWRAVHP